MIHEDFRCEFYFIRHGQSESNATPGMAAGANFDAPLTVIGQKQAVLVGERFFRDKVDFDRIYSSSLTRTVQTSRGMLEGMKQPDREIKQVDAIIEQQIKGWRGVTTREAFTPEVDRYRALKGKDFVGPDGESIREVQRRAVNWLEDEFIYNRELCSGPVSLRVAIIGHGNTSRALFQHIMGFDERLILRLGIDNTSVSRFVFDRGGWSVVCLNDSSHLPRETSGAFEVRT